MLVGPELQVPAAVLLIQPFQGERWDALPRQQGAPYIVALGHIAFTGSGSAPSGRFRCGTPPTPTPPVNIKADTILGIPLGMKADPGSHLATHIVAAIIEHLSGRRRQRQPSGAKFTRGLYQRAPPLTSWVETACIRPTRPALSVKAKPKGLAILEAPTPSQIA